MSVLLKGVSRGGVVICPLNVDTYNCLRTWVPRKARKFVPFQVYLPGCDSPWSFGVSAKCDMWELKRLIATRCGCLPDCLYLKAESHSEIVPISGQVGRAPKVLRVEVNSKKYSFLLVESSYKA